MWEKVKTNLKLTYDVFFAAAKEFGTDRVSRMAAAVAYRGMFATAPLFILAVSVFGLVLGSNARAQQEILSRVADIAGAEIASALDLFLQSVTTSGGTAAVVGFVLLFWTASSLFMEIQADLNDIFHVPQERVEGVWAFVRKRLLGFLWVLGVGVALIAIWGLNALWRFLGDEVLPAGADNVHFVVGLLTPLISVLLLPVVLGLFFQSMSAVKVRWRAIWWGSFLTSIGFLSAAYGVGLYFSWNESPSASQVAASIFVILLLTFVLSTVFLYGAEVIKVYDDYLAEGDVVTPYERAARARKPEAVVAEPGPALPVAAVYGFLAGMFVGWRRRR